MASRVLFEAEGPGVASSCITVISMHEVLQAFLKVDWGTSDLEREAQAGLAKTTEILEQFLRARRKRDAQGNPLGEQAGPAQPSAATMSSDAVTVATAKAAVERSRDERAAADTPVPDADDDKDFEEAAEGRLRGEEDGARRERVRKPAVVARARKRGAGSPPPRGGTQRPRSTSSCSQGRARLERPRTRWSGEGLT